MNLCGMAALALAGMLRQQPGGAGGSVSGVVRDSDGGVLPGAVVALTTMVFASLVERHGWSPAAAVPVVLAMGLGFGAFMGLYGPAAQGIMSHRVDPSEQGQLQGALSSMMGICGMIAPPIFTQTFAKFIDPNGVHAPGAPLVLSGLLTAIALVIALRVTRGVRSSHADAPPSTPHPA